MPMLANREECVGCSACVNVCPKHCIEMIRDIDGFFYPRYANLSDCIGCNRCEKVCPVLNKKNEKVELPKAYAAFTKDESVRMSSSSGGIFTEIAKKIILCGGVVYGAAYDENFVVKHCCVEKIDELGQLRGAKYSQSDLGNIFLEIENRLCQQQIVLFSGTPCQVAGLNSFLKKKYENLYCIDFVCHGVPSPMAWEKYIYYRANKDAMGELPQIINLRSKITGWSKYQYSNVFEYKNGLKYSVKSSDSLFMKLFVGNYISRPSCENCLFKGYQRESDITLGDFWGIWNIDPEMDDDKGTSLVLLQSSRGKSLWEKICKEIKYKEVSLQQTSKENLSILTSSKANLERDDVLARIRDGKICSCHELFETKRISAMGRIKLLVKKLWSCIWRER